MRLEQSRWNQADGWSTETPGKLSGNASLVFLFGSRAILQDQSILDEVQKIYPSALLLGCSTAGEICGTEVTDNTLAVTAVQFAKTNIQFKKIKVSDPDQSFLSGLRLAESLDPNGLSHAFVLSDGLKVNGSELVRGLLKGLPSNVTVTGGLSGDGSDFKETLVLCGKEAAPSIIAILGLYSSCLEVGYASLGGWDPFGPERLITKSKGNILYELDGKSALGLYKEYLGEHAEGLPATGLLFPLCLRTDDNNPGVVRTILSVNESDMSMVFAGDIPEGSYVRLMKANFDRLIDGAAGAAKTTSRGMRNSSPDLALLISCVGRKLVLKQRIEEEIESVRDVLGEKTILTGFYSYGEISPFGSNAKCELHNQTMTITTFSEN